MRWPFGPPHLTLKPSKKNQKKKQKNKKLQKNKPKKQKKETKSKKTQKYQKKKKSFSVISQNVLFFGGCPKIAFFDNLAQKARTPKTL